MTVPESTTYNIRPLQIQLTGNWQVQPAALKVNYPFSEKGEWITVPDSTHLQPVLYPDRPYWGEHLRTMNEQAWIYRRAFSVPDSPYKRVRLYFEGVDYFADVWVNGQLVGKHEGSFAPFYVDVSAAVKSNAENELVVRVSSPWDKPDPKGNYPVDHVIRGLVKGHYEHGEGVIPPNVNPIGIWRPVSVVLDDGISLDRFRIRTQLNGQVDLQVTCTNTTNESWQGTLKLHVTAENHNSGGAEASHSVKIVPGTHQLDYTLKIDNPQLWWPWDHGDPNLYRLEASLSDDSGQVVSQREEVFGIRTVRLERSAERFTFWINDRPIFIRGSSYMSALYLSQCSHESLEKDVRLAREANLNLLRVHVHVSPPELYELCDRAGMLIWQDFELNWVQDYSVGFEKRAQILQREMIAMLGNHPSIITWTCHNEPTMVFARRQNLEQHPDPVLYTDALEQDPTRPVFICSGQMENDWQRAGDIHSYYGAIWTRRYNDIYTHSFRLNTEFGFEVPGAVDTLRIYPDLWERLKHLETEIDELWAYQAELIQYQIEHLRRLRATCSAGYIHFWLVDLVPQVGCGVLDAQRQPKGGYAALKRASQPLHVMLEHDGKNPIALWILNDTQEEYTDTMIRWRVLDSSNNVLLEGEKRYSVAANASQRVSDANWGLSVEGCARVELALYNSVGDLLTENSYEHPFQPRLRPRGYPWKFDRYLGTKVFDRPDAPSLADYSINWFFRLAPLAIREQIAEWALRQHFPEWFTSGMARIIDRVTG